MFEQELRDRLLCDLNTLGIPECFELVLKPFSKTFYGCFRPETNRVFLYVHTSLNSNTLYPYNHLLSKAIHEACHALQWNDKRHIRIKGTMHDEAFFKMLNKYTTLAERRGLMKP